MNLNVANFNSWDQIKSGSGSVSISNDGRKARCYGGVGSGAQLWMRFPISYGGFYKVSFYAKKNKGDGYAWIVDSKGDRNMNSVKIMTEQWERYEFTGGVQITNKNGDGFTRISVGVATADDGDIEICDISVQEFNSTFGQLRTIAAGIISLTNGSPSISHNHGGVTLVSLSSDGYTLEITCQKLHQSIKTPMIFITGMNSGRSEKTGEIRSQYYDKENGKALIQLIGDDKKPKILTDTNLMFSFEVKCI